MEINGLPLHPLVVHAAVVFGPLAALAALAYAVRADVARPAALGHAGRWSLIAVGVDRGRPTSAASNFLDSDRSSSSLGGETQEQIEHHEDLRRDRCAGSTLGLRAWSRWPSRSGMHDARRGRRAGLRSLAALLVVVGAVAARWCWWSSPATPAPSAVWG